MIKHRFFQALAIGFVLLYGGVEFAGWFNLDAVSPYAESVFQAIFGFLIFLIYRNWEWKKKSFTFGAGVAFFFALAAGFAVYEASGVMRMALPFSVRDAETGLFLLIVWPVLEEWIFRGALWRLLETISGSPWPAFLITAIALSYWDYRQVSALGPKYLLFARYQAIYVLGLGLFCGGLRLQFGWIAALIAHLAFNFGFWLAAL